MTTIEYGISSKLESNTGVEVQIFDRTYNKSIASRTYMKLGPAYTFEAFNNFIYEILENRHAMIHLSSTSDADIDAIEYGNHRVSFLTKNARYCSRIDINFTDRNRDKLVTELMELNMNLKKISSAATPQIGMY